MLDDTTDISGGLPQASSPLLPQGNGPDRGLLAYARNPTPLPNGNAVGGFENVNPRADVGNLNPNFAQRLSQLQQAAKQAGIETSIMSGFRGNDLQAKLYANYQAKQSGKALPYPEEGGGGIAAPPGQSYHNFGLAADMYAKEPSKQQWLVDNAPKYGLYPGANFGDPGHFQLAGASPQGPGQQGAPNTAMDIRPNAQQQASASASPSPQGQPAPATPKHPNPMNLLLLSAMFPKFQFHPIDYDPFKYQVRL